MKILVFSDTHLGLPFEEKKYNFMTSIIKESDQVIINGDFWEGFFMSFEQFVESPWKQLFPLLKSKNAVYIYGNHDEASFMNKAVNLFSDVQTDRYEILSGDSKLIVEHGNRIVDLMRWPDLPSKTFEHIEKMMVNKIGSKFYKFISEKRNGLIKERVKKELKANETFICGHTHYAEVDKENKFVNSGVIRNGLGQYLVIENNRITSKEEWYA